MDQLYIELSQAIHLLTGISQSLFLEIYSFSKNVPSEWVKDYCLTSKGQFVSYKNVYHGENKLPCRYLIDIFLHKNCTYKNVHSVIAAVHFAWKRCSSLLYFIYVIYLYLCYLSLFIFYLCYLSLFIFYLCYLSLFIFYLCYLSLLVFYLCYLSLFIFYLCYLSLFTYTGVQHDFHIRWC